MDKTWTVVKFLEENTVEAVPTNWLVGNMCYWPPYTREKVINSIRNYDELNTCWPTHKISIFRNGTFNNYLEARNKTKVAEYSSDLNNDDDPKSRKFRKKRCAISSEESEEENILHRIPPPPLKPAISTTAVIVSSQKEAPLESPDIQSSSTEKEKCCRCCPLHGQQLIDKQMTKIMKQYLFIGNILTDISAKMENISIQGPPIKEVDSIFTKFPFFPLNNAEHLSEIENYLGDVTNFKAACNELSKLGGSSGYEFIRRAMSQLMANSFAATYSFHGRKNKLKFIELKISNLIICAAEIHGKENTTKKNIEDDMMKWLRRASERK